MSIPASAAAAALIRSSCSRWTAELGNLEDVEDAHGHVVRQVRQDARHAEEPDFPLLAPDTSVSTVRSACICATLGEMCT
jgi:hypothetical protein